MAETVFCSECGVEIAKDSKYCPECGEKQHVGTGHRRKDDPEEEPSFDDAEEDFYSSEGPAEKAENAPDESARQFLYEEDEKLIDVLGQGFINSIITEGNISKGVMVLSDKRIYQKGYSYLREDSEWSTKKGSKVVSISDITGTSFTEYRDDKSLAITIIPLVILGILFSLALGSTEGGGIAGLVLPLGLIVAIIALYNSGIFKRKLFVVEYAGGAIGVEIGWYDKEKVKNFRRKIFLKKNK